MENGSNEVATRIDIWMRNSIIKRLLGLLHAVVYVISRRNALLALTLNHRVESSKLIQITPLQTPLISSLNLYYLYFIPAIEVALS